MAKMNERYQLSFGQKVVAGLAAVGLTASSMLPYRSSVYAQDIALLPPQNKPVEQPEVPKEPEKPVEPVETGEPPVEKPSKSKRYNFESFQRLSEYVKLKGRELDRNREDAFESVEGYHTHARHLVEDASDFAEYLNKELIREYKVVRDLEAKDSKMTAKLRKYTETRINSLESLRDKVQNLLDSLPATLKQETEQLQDVPEAPVEQKDVPAEQKVEPQPEEVPVEPQQDAPEQPNQYDIEDAEEQLRKLDRAFPENQTDEHSYIRNGYRQLAALLAEISIMPTSMETEAANRVGPVEIFEDLYSFARERTVEMNAFLDSMEAKLKSDFEDQNAVVAEMKRYEKFVDAQLGLLRERQNAFEESFEWTEDESNRIRELLGEPEGK